ncbi:MAG: chemotaxis response regulator protein-glutamate methylesterase [Bacteriovoracaceae bacterium]|nr:chemotaxis response regulator protein-glutamate methylesterase [Bacteriovoracaceae bacterium]
MRKTIKVLVVDDSALVRKIFSEQLSRKDGIEVVAVASDPYQARDLIVLHNPDVVTLDVEMPKMDGVEFLKKLMPQYPLPIVMVSSLTTKGAQVTFDALEAGAIDFVIKPTAMLDHGLNILINEIASKILIASTIDVSHWKSKREALYASFKHIGPTSLNTTDKLVVIGASTGGTEAVKHVLEGLPYNSPGIVIVQHMPPGFTKAFADRLNRVTRLEVKEAEDGDRVITGRVLISPGGMQLTIVRSGGEYRVKIIEGDRVNGHAPSVSVLFDSVAEVAKENAIGVMLTGMGKDGAYEMTKMKNNGACTLAQDEKSSVVFGMPKAAIDCGGVTEVLPLNRIAERIITALKD